MFSRGFMFIPVIGRYHMISRRDSHRDHRVVNCINKVPSVLLSCLELRISSSKLLARFPIPELLYQSCELMRGRSSVWCT